MSKSIIVVGFTGLGGHPDNPDSITMKIDQRLGMLGNSCEHHRFGWRYKSDALALIKQKCGAIGESLRLVLYGHSYGGGAAIQVASELTNSQVVVDGLGSIDENIPGVLFASHRKIPFNIVRAYNCYTDTPGYQGRSLKKSNPATELKQQHFPDVRHTYIDTHEPVLDELIALIRIVVEESKGVSSEVARKRFETFAMRKTEDETKFRRLVIPGTTQPLATAIMQAFQKVLETLSPQERDRLSVESVSDTLVTLVDLALVNLVPEARMIPTGIRRAAIRMILDTVLDAIDLEDADLT